MNHMLEIGTRLIYCERRRNATLHARWSTVDQIMVRRLWGGCVTITFSVLWDTGCQFIPTVP